MNDDSVTLRKAAAYLRANGWQKGGYGFPGGPRCMAGALRSVTGIEPEEDDTGEYVRLLRLLRRVTATRWLADFNDAVCRSAEDAIAALEIAADLAAPVWKP